MGQGVAMSGRMRWRKAAFALLVGLLPAGCGNAPEGQVALAQSRALLGAAGMVPTADHGLELVSPALILVQVETAPEGAAMGHLQHRDEVDTWGSLNLMTISTRGGLLVATRGFGQDLVSADLPPVALIARGRGAYMRSHWLPDDQDQVRQLDFDCTLSRGGLHARRIGDRTMDLHLVIERCTDAAVSFENSYLFDENGELMSSRQWIGPALGHLLLARPKA